MLLVMMCEREMCKKKLPGIGMIRKKDAKNNILYTLSYRYPRSDIPYQQWNIIMLCHETPLAFLTTSSEAL